VSLKFKRVMVGAVACPFVAKNTNLGVAPTGVMVAREGDVILLGDDDTNNLVDYKYKPHWKGERGEHGLGKDCHGREGKPAVLRMPLGTVVIDEATDKGGRGSD
jgi:GTPase involved in cell partitioning and DNA repair